jgi:hypothetical protein
MHGVGRLRESRIGRTVAASTLLLALLATGMVATGSATPSGASTSTPILDNMLCLHTVGTGFNNPIDQIILQNAIQLIDFQPAVLGRTMQCNPVSTKVYRAGHVRATWVTNTSAHALCWGLTYTWKPYTVQITNQFGTATMSTGSPTQVCLPTWASTTGAVQRIEIAPAGLDYFTCYPLSTIAGDPQFTPSSSVRVQLQPMGPFYNVTVQTPTKLCVPSTFIDNNVQYNTQTSTDSSMTCFNVAASLELPKRYFNQDVFGSGISYKKWVNGLCLPSTIQVDGPTPP